MKIIWSESDRPEPVRRGVTLGFFDGMHRGHQLLIRTLTSLAAEKGLRSCVFTFDRHPSERVHDRALLHGYLNDLDARVRQIEGEGVDEIYLQHFNNTLSEMNECAFLDFLRNTLQTSLIVVGYDFRFGKNRAGDVDTIRAWGLRHGIDVVVVDALAIRGTTVSSSAVRQRIADGDMEATSCLLGRDYTIHGLVERGRNLGSQLGFPTANITIADGQVVPASGVYATRTRVDGITYESITNIGTRPTVDGDSDRIVVETYLLDVQKDMYDKDIEVAFLHRLRGEKRFNGLLELSANIKEDIDTTRAYHASSEQLWQAATVRGIPLYLLRTDRFRTATLTVTFRLPLTSARATAGNLLLRILGSCCRRLPTRQGLSLELDRLYGARLDTHADKEGDLLALNFHVDSLAFGTDKSPVFHDAARLLMDVILDPLVGPDDLFDNDILETEKAGYAAELQARWNDRDRYALDNGLAWYLDGTPHGIDAAGDPDILEKLTARDLKSLYEEMKTQASVLVVAGGNLTAAERDWLVNSLEAFPEAARPAPVQPGLQPGPARIKEGFREKKERRPVEQTRLIKVFTGLPPYFSADNMAVNVLNSMLGGHPHSLLFTHVRERLGLAYSVFSAVLRYVRGLVVYAGVTGASVDAALNTVDEQVQLLASGQQDPDLFGKAVVMVRSQLRSLQDSLGALLQFYTAGLLNGRLFAVADALELLEAVTPEQVCALAAQLQPASLYLLTEDGEETR